MAPFNRVFSPMEEARIKELIAEALADRTQAATVEMPAVPAEAPAEAKPKTREPKVK